MWNVFLGIHDLTIREWRMAIPRRKDPTEQKTSSVAETAR